MSEEKQLKSGSITWLHLDPESLHFPLVYLGGPVSPIILAQPGAPQALGRSCRLEPSSAPRHFQGWEGEYSFRTLAVTSATTFFPAWGLPPRLGEGVKRGSSGQDGGQMPRGSKDGSIR